MAGATLSGTKAQALEAAVYPGSDLFYSFVSVLIAVLESELRPRI